ncbi:MAG TPA: hypothetical protein VGI40_19015 [Pirellulaceae bacterium]
MTDHNFLNDLEAFVTADSLFSPAIGQFDENELVSDIPFELFRFDSPIAVVTTVGVPNGYVLQDTMLDVLLGEADASLASGQASQPFRPDFVISPTLTFSGILEVAEKRNAQMLVVASEEEILGSLSLENLLWRRGMLLLRELGRELGQVTLELCTFHSTSFYTLPQGRQQKAKDDFRMKGQARWDALRDVAEPRGKRADADCMRRELIQCTTFRDKKTMLFKSELGLKTDRRTIVRTFNFFERIRKYCERPQATYTHDCHAASVLEGACHEKITPDDRMPIFVSIPIHKTLRIKNISDLARAVRDCKELIADISAAV